MTKPHGPVPKAFGMQHDILAAQFDHEFLQGVQVVGDRTVDADLAAGIGEGDFVAFFVDIQSDVLMILLHELASGCVGLLGLRFSNHCGSAPNELAGCNPREQWRQALSLSRWNHGCASPFTQP